MGFIRKFLIWALLIPAVLLALLLEGPRLLGLEVCTVRDDSMEALPAGSLLYVREADPRTLEAGSVITYMVSQEQVQTHRIAGVVPDEKDPSEIRFRTRADASRTEDATLVYYRNVLGVPVFTIPLLGYAADWFGTTVGLWTAVALGMVWLLLVLLPLFFRGRKKRQKGGKYLK